MSGLGELERIINQRFIEREKSILSGVVATFSGDAERRYEEKYPGIRPAFSRDADRILHSFAFTRYIDKTQVFYLSDNDFITHRVIHVQLVSKIGRLIARALRLNEDLVEAIALGHDIGHTPFGHEGEANISSEITEKLQTNPFFFRHSVQSVRFLDNLEGQYQHSTGRSLNLTLQVLDGILCHDGEKLQRSLKPKSNKTWTDFDKEIENKKTQKNVSVIPMTMEGCIVRFADVIAYIGRDIEDAISVGILKRDEFPSILGSTNREIVNSLVIDLINNSLDKDEISYSEEIFDHLTTIFEFNYEHIYLNDLVKAQKVKVKDMFVSIFHKLLKDVQQQKRDSPIFVDHIDLIDNGDQKQKYFKNNAPEMIVVDYISGMTDDYFMNVFNDLHFPRKLPFNYRQIHRMTGLRKEKIMELCHD